LDKKKKKSYLNIYSASTLVFRNRVLPKNVVKSIFTIRVTSITSRKTTTPEDSVIFGYDRLSPQNTELGGTEAPNAAKQHNSKDDYHYPISKNWTAGLAHGAVSCF
jgi:hypothetical protein